jgi:hypothetical protein
MNFEVIFLLQPSPEFTVELMEMIDFFMGQFGEEAFSDGADEAFNFAF